MNEQKSDHVTFTLHHGSFPSVFLNNSPIPTSYIVCLLGLLTQRRGIKLIQNLRYKLLLSLLNPCQKLQYTKITNLQPSPQTPLDLYNRVLGSSNHQNTAVFNLYRKMSNSIINQNFKVASVHSTSPALPNYPYKPTQKSKMRMPKKPPSHKSNRITCPTSF